MCTQLFSYVCSIVRSNMNSDLGQHNIDISTYRLRIPAARQTNSTVFIFIGFTLKRTTFHEFSSTEVCLICFVEFVALWKIIFELINVEVLRSSSINFIIRINVCYIFRSLLTALGH